jgi:hypothetical protein
MLLSVKLHREYYGHKATAEGLFGARAELEQAAEFIRQKTARDMPRSRIPPPPASDTVGRGGLPGRYRGSLNE